MRCPYRTVHRRNLLLPELSTLDLVGWIGYPPRESIYPIRIGSAWLVMDNLTIRVIAILPATLSVKVNAEHLRGLPWCRNGGGLYEI